LCFRKKEDDFLDTVARMMLDSILYKLFRTLQPGKVLYLGSGMTSYKENVPHTCFITADIERECHPDICCDAHSIPCQNESFDTVIAIELLEHCHTPQKVIDEIFRVLKREKGICILSTRFIYPIHGEPYDFYIFTKNSLSRLFYKFDEIKIYPHGDRLASVWDLVSLKLFSLKILNPFIKILSKDGGLCPCGWVVYAKK